MSVADVQQTCGISVSQPKKHFSESGKGVNACVRNAPFGKAPGEGITFRIAAHGTVAQAQGYFRHAAGGKPLADLGDEAKFSEELSGYGPHRALILRKSASVIEVTHHWGRKGKPTCTQGQLLELSRRILSRLPQ
jgi:hypothetical protein